MNPDPQYLHLGDANTLDFEAQVLACRPLGGGRSSVLLDRTYFYATGGGQEHDNGWLGAARVVDVVKDEANGVVLHTIEGELAPGAVHGRIDGLRRQRHMQHHSAQHLLSACFLQRFGIESVSANINGDSPSTVDLDTRRLEAATIAGAEEYANQVILEDRPIRSYFVTPAELAALPLRKPPKVSENVRIVEIEGFDYTPCGGTHVARSGMIGPLKILKSERVNDKLRIHFAAGWQALEIFRSSYELVSGLAASLSLHPQELPAAYQRQAEALKSAQRELEALRRERQVLEAQTLAAQAAPRPFGRLVVQDYPGRPAAELRQLAERLKSQADLVAVLASHDGAKAAVVVMCGASSGRQARAVLADLLAPSGGRGGGDAQLAQGGGPASGEAFAALLAAARAL